MGKVLIAIFDDENEATFEELLLFLRSKKDIEVVNAFSMDNRLDYGSIIIDAKYRVVEVAGKSIGMTNYEFEILYLLARHPGQVFSKEQIYNQVWKEPYYGAEDNVMSLIRRIRKKIEPDPSKPIYILTVWGVGYKFNNAIKRK
ncbi:MAG: winged helix-turn-helix domain-containing protein [Eubacteriales bacterium]|nr:winged helix-turn-helix domain-containing protein [Eubacteriales bacterium]